MDSESITDKKPIKIVQKTKKINIIIGHSSCYRHCSITLTDKRQNTSKNKKNHIWYNTRLGNLEKQYRTKKTTTSHTQ